LRAKEEYEKEKSSPEESEVTTQPKKESRVSRLSKKEQELLTKEQQIYEIAKQWEDYRKSVFENPIEFLEKLGYEIDNSIKNQRPQELQRYQEELSQIRQEVYSIKEEKALAELNRTIQNTETSYLHRHPNATDYVADYANRYYKYYNKYPSFEEAVLGADAEIKTHVDSINSTFGPSQKPSAPQAPSKRRVSLNKTSGTPTSRSLNFDKYGNTPEAKQYWTNRVRELESTKK